MAFWLCSVTGFMQQQHSCKAYKHHNSQYHRLAHGLDGPCLDYQSVYATPFYCSIYYAGSQRKEYREVDGSDNYH